MTDAGGEGLGKAREVEARIQRPLPPAVREWAAFIEDCPRLGLSSVLVLSGFGPDLELLTEIESGESWWAREDDLHLTDPPVHFLDGEDGHAAALRDGREPAFGAVSWFGLLFAMSGGASGGGYLVSWQEGMEDALASAFQCRCHFGELSIYESENIVARVGKSRPYWSRELYVRLRKRIPRRSIPPLLFRLAGSADWHREPEA